MEALKERYKLLEEENAVLRNERDKFRRLASANGTEIVRQRIESLELQAKYEELLAKKYPKKEYSSESVQTETPETSQVHNRREQEGYQTTTTLSSSLKRKGFFKSEPEIVAKKQRSDEITKPCEVAAVRLKTDSRPRRHPQNRLDMSMEADTALATAIDSRERVKLKGKAALKKGALSSYASTSGHLPSPARTSPSPSQFSDVLSPFVSVKQLKVEEPKFKVKAEGGWTLSPSKVSKYLGSATLFTIKPLPLPVLVSRKALTEAYGLPGMGLLWNPKNKPHKFLTPLMIIPNIDVNPEMPRCPGAPGLLLSCRKDMCKDGPWTLFVKVETSKKVHLDYAGEYTCTAVGEMTKEEFLAQDAKVKITWGEKVANHKRYPIYRELRARITLRKQLGSEPTEEQVQTEAELIKKKEYKGSLDIQDVVAAFERGEESISIVKVECMAYSHERARDYVKAEETCDANERAVALAKANGTYVKPMKGKKKQCKPSRSSQKPQPDSESEHSEDEGGASDSDDMYTDREAGSSTSPAVNTPLRSMRERKKSFKALMREEGTWPSAESELSEIDSG
ncbi:hypothetical protein BDZ97DRAFT_1845697 [Flammula alnicola]|nr:hypothetical protein BDZ97DRAFT_1845697 [Flammula alnicola]